MEKIYVLCLATSGNGITPFMYARTAQDARTLASNLAYRAWTDKECAIKPAVFVLPATKMEDIKEGCNAYVVFNAGTGGLLMVPYQAYADYTTCIKGIKEAYNDENNNGDYFVWEMLEDIQEKNLDKAYKKMLTKI